MGPFRRLLSELRQRHVFRVAGAYAAAAFVLVEGADLVVDPLGLPQWTMAMVILMVALGFPLALILSWALELTPEGVRRAAPSELLARMPIRRRLFTSGGVAMATAVLAGVLLHVAPLRQADEAPPSVAVLPFVDLSALGDQAYFSDGLAEELLTALSRVDGLRVASRTASFQFREAGVDLAEIGRRLQVRTVLEGSVRRTEDRLRVTVRLVDVRNGYELWTRAYDRRLSDVFAVQEEIAREILGALRFPGTSVELVQHGTQDLVAYDHLLRGNYRLARRTPDEVRGAIAEYEAAVAADPTAAIPLFRQAYASLIYADWGWSHPELSTGELVDRARSLVDRGLALEPDSGEGWLARAYLHVVEDPFAMRSALDAFERALSLDGQSAEAWHQYGQTLMVLGRYEDAAVAYERALRIDPKRSMTLVPLAAMALVQGEPGEALRWGDSAVATDPANSYARANRARTYLVAGDVERAREEAEIAVQVDQGHTISVLATLVTALAHDGVGDEADEVLERTLALAGSGELSAGEAAFLAFAATSVGELDIAISLLERGEPKGAWYWFYLQNPLFDELRSDVRFQRLVEAADPTRPAGVVPGPG